MWKYWRSHRRRLRVAAWREIKRRSGAVAKVQAAYRGRRLREREIPDVVAELRNALFYVRHFRRQEASRAACLRLQAWGRGWHGRQPQPFSSLARVKLGMPAVTTLQLVRNRRLAIGGLSRYRMAF